MFSSCSAVTDDELNHFKHLELSFVPKAPCVPPHSITSQAEHVHCAWPARRTSAPRLAEPTPCPTSSQLQHKQGRVLPSKTQPLMFATRCLLGTSVQAYVFINNTSI